MRRHGRGGTCRLLDGAVLVPLALSPLVGYLTVLTVAAWWARATGGHRTPRPVTPLTPFVVMVPAHDEERMIGATVASLQQAARAYGESVEVHVVADHCTDRTAEIARSAGADVHEHDDPEPAGKGAALTWLGDRLAASRSHTSRDRAETETAFVIVDADTVVDAHFFEVLDARFQAGALVVQVRYDVRDADVSPATSLRAAALAARHYVRPLGRTVLGASSGLYGNGMALRAGVLRRRAWSDHLTEDLELQSELVLDGVAVDFAPDAIVSAEMPVGLAESQSQHERWERGRIELARRYLPRLVRAVRTERGRRRLLALDTALDHAVPPLSALAAATGASLVVTGLARAIRPTPALRLATGASVAMCAALAAHVLSALKLVDAPASRYRALLGAPRLIGWKLTLWARMLLGSDDVAWVRTTRNAELADASDTFEATDPSGVAAEPGSTGR